MIKMFSFYSLWASSNDRCFLWKKILLMPSFLQQKQILNSDFLKDKIWNDEQIALIVALLNNTDSCLETGRNTTNI